MPKLDSLKEELITLRFWLSIIVASILGIIGWVGVNFQKIEFWFLIVLVFIVLCLSIGLIVVMRLMNKKINQIRKAKK